MFVVSYFISLIDGDNVGVYSRTISVYLVILLEMDDELQYDSEMIDINVELLDGELQNDELEEHDGSTQGNF